VEYRPGWGAGRDLAEVLSDQLPGDRERGFTHAGPHRADMELTSGGIPVRSIYSRGQQKLLVAALVLAQVRCLGESGQGRAVLLVDDLAAELDRERRRALLELLAGSGAQGRPSPGVPRGTWPGPAGGIMAFLPRSIT